MPDDEMLDEPDADEPDADEPDADEPDADEPAADEPIVLPEHEGILAKLGADLGDDILEAVSNHGELVVRVANSGWHRAAEAAKARLDCAYLSFVSAIDWMPRPNPPGWDPDAPSAPVQPQQMSLGVAGGTGRLQVFAVVESTDDKVQVIFKTDVDDADPRVASWTDVYPGADWHERECWEMFGISFDGHPHLRHLYLPSDFEGHPLRKDFPLLSREVKPWPGLVDVELMPGGGESEEEGAGEPAEATAGGET